MTTDDLLSKLRTAIKGPHASIHRLNLARIALCLPPRVDGVGLYALGLSRYAELFYEVEAAWASLIGDPGDITYQQAEIIGQEQGGLDPKTRVQTLLRRLYMPELQRTRALKTDLQFLRALDVTRNPDIWESINDWNAGRQVRQEIHRRILDKPHILVAYIWIMYSSMLYGGRVIRAQLLKAGPDFWGLSAAELSPHRRTPCPLSFWQIDDDVGVKVKFRVRVAEVEQFLSSREQQDIFEEARAIFGMFEMLTRSLDEEAKRINAA
ncbi:uncharacterized protein N7482_008117 [Penicillium canariense]|uniref:Heme-binding peroxidase n=1 Tax=Penicillium canariense TaxID=189055 RepID=A0A9W9LIG0_9EURO|nr:uncharacterized protein N7482_008117 [Penicillium canariense]KAJ5157017.1 hypothetical protein N7482_008117 [Penicillium canariense]